MILELTLLHLKSLINFLKTLISDLPTKAYITDHTFVNLNTIFGIINVMNLTILPFFMLKTLCKFLM
jgi:hypothetical protein